MRKRAPSWLWPLCAIAACADGAWSMIAAHTGHWWLAVLCLAACAWALCSAAIPRGRARGDG